MAPAVVFSVSPTSPAVIAAGPATLSQLTVRLPAGNFQGLSVRVGAQDPVPLAYFFGLGSTGDEALDHGWASVRSAIHHVDPQTFLPFQLGTGTEDYFNGGWYFLSTLTNALSGQPRFAVDTPEDGWAHARFEHALYRDHVLDPIVGRAGVHFGFEAGEFGCSVIHTRARTRAAGIQGRLRNRYARRCPCRIHHPAPAAAHSATEGGR